MLNYLMPKNRSKIFITVNNVKYYLAHTGLNGNISYQIFLKVGQRLFYLELVNDVGKWSFHVELKEKFIYDSRIGKKFYDTPEAAHSEMINLLFLKYNFENESTIV